MSQGGNDPFSGLGGQFTGKDRTPTIEISHAGGQDTADDGSTLLPWRHNDGFQSSTHGHQQNQSQQSNTSASSLGVPSSRYQDPLAERVAKISYLTYGPAGSRCCAMKDCDSTRWSRIKADSSFGQLPTGPFPIHEPELALSTWMRDDNGEHLPFCTEHSLFVGLHRLDIADEKGEMVVDDASRTEYKKDFSQLREEGIDLLDAKAIEQSDSFKFDPFNYCPGTLRTVCGRPLSLGEGPCSNDLTHYVDYHNIDPGSADPEQIITPRTETILCWFGTNQKSCKTLKRHRFHPTSDGISFKNDSGTVKKADDPSTELCYDCETYLINQSRCVSRACGKQASIKTNNHCLDCYTQSTESKFMPNDWLDMVGDSEGGLALNLLPGSENGVYHGPPFVQSPKPYSRSSLLRKTEGAAASQQDLRFGDLAKIGPF